MWYDDLSEGRNEKIATCVDSDVPQIRGRLEQVFNPSWLERQGTHLHPLQRLWQETTYYSRLLIAQLDYDLCQTSPILGQRRLIRKLSHPQEFYPTFYELHIAALFAPNLGKGWSVTFEPNGPKTEPDILIRTPTGNGNGDVEIYVSCKFQRRSQAEKDFFYGSERIHSVALRLAKERQRQIFRLTCHFAERLEDSRLRWAEAELDRLFNNFDGTNELIAEDEAHSRLMLGPAWAMSQLYSTDYDYVEHAYQINIAGDIPPDEYSKCLNGIYNAYLQIRKNRLESQVTLLAVNVGSFLNMVKLEKDLVPMVENQMPEISALLITRWCIGLDLTKVYCPLEEPYIYTNRNPVVLPWNRLIEVPEARVMGDTSSLHPQMQRTLRNATVGYETSFFEVLLNLDSTERDYYFSLPGDSKLTKLKAERPHSRVILKPPDRSSSRVRLVQAIDR